MNWFDSISSYMGGGSGKSVLAANPELMQMNNYGANVTGAAPITTLPNQDGGSWFGGLFDGFLDKTDANGIKTQGWGGLALTGLQGLGNSYMGMKQFGLAEDALKEQKRQFNVNFEAQRKMTNSQLADRQRARVVSNTGAYQSEAEYMKQWGI